MADVSTLEHPDVYWEEVTETRQSKRPQQMTAIDFVATRNKPLDAEPMRMICRCWRCRAGGVSLLAMPVFDRLLARHLLRMGKHEREFWLREWELNPNHGTHGRYALEAWIRIEKGFKHPEPSYHPRRLG